MIDEIQRIRGNNNVLWMNILRIALASAPDDTNQVLRQITANDRQISELLARLADDPTNPLPT